MLTTISDRKIPVYSNGSLNLPGGFTVPVADYFEPDMVSATDYYPFGMVSRGVGPSDKYRFGFNGKENDNEVKGFAQQQDYGERTYDPRIGRLLSVDPISKDYPELTPYQFASNRPIDGVDLLGLQWFPPHRPPLSGSGGYRYISPVEVMARNTGLRIRHATLEEQVKQARLTELRETRQGIRGMMNRFRTGLLQYESNVLQSAQSVFGTSVMSNNRRNGSDFETEVNTALLNNPNYQRVIQQVTFSVENNSGVKVKVRVDNVAVRYDGSLDFVEAKFSIYEITRANVTQTLTLNQKDFFNIIINRDVAKITFLGGAAKATQLGALSGTDVIGRINLISIITPVLPPITPAATSNANANANGNTNSGGNVSPSSGTGNNTTATGSNSNNIP